MAPSDDADFASVAEEVYAVPPSRFVAERTARAKAARAAGDRDLAARITALPKPSASAALVNLLVRGGDDLDRVLDLGAALRSAQEDGDRERLRELGSQRRELLAEVSRNAADRAAQADWKPSAAVLEELQQTLQAVLSDEGAAAAVGTGRLVHALTADGLDPADLTNAVGGPGAIRSKRRAAPARSAGTDEGADEERARQQQQEEAERRAQDAADRAEAARRAADEAADLVQDAEAEVGTREDAVRDLRDRLDELQRQLDAAQHALDVANQAADRARDAEQEAARTADDAESEAADLRDALEP